MSEILTREQFEELSRDIYSYWRAGEPADNEHLIEEYIAATDALLDAHDAALEALRFYADEEHYAHSGAVGTWDDTGLGIAFLVPDVGSRARAALAAVATPQGREVDA